jgi:streptogramin lyase
MGTIGTRLRHVLALLAIAPAIGLLPAGSTVDAQYAGHATDVAAPGSFTIFGLSRSSMAPEAITSGPGKYLWVAVTGADLVGAKGAIARVSTSGAISYFPIPVDSIYQNALSSITTGPDGNLWSFLGVNIPETLISVSPSGVGRVVAFPLVKHQAVARYVTRGAGDDQHLYYDFDVQFETPRIAQITTTGHLSALVPLHDQHLAGPFTPGPDGNVWFVDTTTGSSKDQAFGGAGYITPTSAVREFNLFHAPFQPGGITTGPDGNIWITGHGIQYQKQGYNYPVARITPTGTVTVVDDPFFGEAIGPITSGADGNLYLANATTIERVTPNFVFTSFASPTGLFPGGLSDITVGPDHNLWATDTALGPHPTRYIVRLTAPARFSATPVPAKALVNVPAPLVVLARFTDASPGATASDYSGTVHWGEGSYGMPPTPLTITGGKGSFIISSQGHTYPAQPTVPYTSPVTITMKSKIDGGVTVINTTATVSVP